MANQPDIGDAVFQVKCELLGVEILNSSEPGPFILVRVTDGTWWYDNTRLFQAWRFNSPEEALQSYISGNGRWKP